MRFAFKTELLESLANELARLDPLVPGNAA